MNVEIKNGIGKLLLLTLALLLLLTSCGRAVPFGYDPYDPNAARSGSSADMTGAGDDTRPTKEHVTDPTFTGITVVPSPTKTTAAEQSGSNDTTTQTSSLTDTATEPASTAETEAFTLPDFSDEGSPLLWKVTKDGSEGVLYLFGSIHVARYGEKLVPKQVKEILYRCDALAVENDVIAIERDTVKSMKCNQEMVYRDGTKIKDHISDELYQKLVSLVKAVGYGDYMPFFQIYDCSFWVTFIEQMVLYEKMGIDMESGVDRTLLELAKEENIDIIELEDAVENYRNLLSPENDDYALISLKELLSDDFDKDLKELTLRMYEMIDSWKSGDLEREKASMEEDYSDLSFEEIAIVNAYNKKILDDRNVKMIEKAEEMIENGQTVLYVVGNAHVVCDGGLIDALTEKGYTIERLETKLP